MRPPDLFSGTPGLDALLQLLEYMRGRQEEAGYVEVNTPDVMDRGLWKNLATGKTIETTCSRRKQRMIASTLKPMNCPGSVSMFAQGLKSYRDLPLRMAEFGKVHRYEPSGALHGLMRVRHFTQDDAHIYCTKEQMDKSV